MRRECGGAEQGRPRQARVVRVIGVRAGHRRSVLLVPSPPPRLRLGSGSTTGDHPDMRYHQQHHGRSCRWEAARATRRGERVGRACGGSRAINVVGLAVAVAVAMDMWSIRREGARKGTGGKVGKNAWNGGAGRAGAQRAAAQRQGVELSGFSGAAAPFYSICWVCFVISMPWLDRRHHELSDIRSTSVSSRHREMDGWRNFWGQEVPKNGYLCLCGGGVPRWLT